MSLNASVAKAPRICIIAALSLDSDTLGRGRSSGVERNLAKVEAEGSNPSARSNYLFENLMFYWASLR